MANVLMIHPDRCTGCRNCSLACSFRHEGQFRPAASRVHVYSWEREGFSVPTMCQQCDTAPCVNVCPTGALNRAKGTHPGCLQARTVHWLPHVHHGLPIRRCRLRRCHRNDPQVRPLRRRSGVRSVLSQPGAGVRRRQHRHPLADESLCEQVQERIRGGVTCTDGAAQFCA